MKKSQLPPLPDYFQKTIDFCEDVTPVEILQLAQNELLQWDWNTWKTLGTLTYQEGKWTLNDILQHLIDSTWIFAYRALCYSRGEKLHLPVYDEDEYARNASANHRNPDELVFELHLLYSSTIALFKSFDHEKLVRTGMSFKGEYTVASIAFIIAGHQRRHFKTLQERYSHLLDPNLLNDSTSEVHV